jgi:hypothetical protein
MMRGRGTRSGAPRHWVRCGALVAAAALSVADAAERDYRYFFLQGSLAEAGRADPIHGAIVRLTGEAGRFETTTDPRGVFVFERLPVAPFELEIVTPEGLVIRGTQELASSDPLETRIRLKLRRGTGMTIGVDPGGAPRVASDLPAPRFTWKKLWVEVGVFVGAAALLAL